MENVYRDDIHTGEGSNNEKMNVPEARIHGCVNGDRLDSSSPIKYTSLNDVPRRTMSYEAPWSPGPTGFEPKDLEPPRFEYRDLQERVLYTDYNEQVNTTGIASKMTRTYGHRFWGEFFSVLMPITDFVFALVLEAFGFVSRVITHLLLGLTVRCSDYVLKPWLVFTFNACSIPCLTHIHTALKTLVRAIQPLIELIESLVTIASIPIKSLNLIRITINKNKSYNTGEPFTA